MTDLHALRRPSCRHSQLYAVLVLLYTAEFRRAYGPDLLAFFDDLVADRGPRRAWARTGVDLLVSLPRHRLENAMSESRRATLVLLLTAGLMAGAVQGILLGVYAIGPVFVVLAAALVIAERSTLARALRTPDTGRGRRLRLGGASALVFAISLVAYLIAIGDGQISAATLVTVNVVGLSSLVAALVLVGAGLLTPKGPRTA
jgi:hypothetical protein